VSDSSRASSALWEKLRAEQRQRFVRTLRELALGCGKRRSSRRRPMISEERASARLVAFVTALMTDLLAPEPHETVLEIGTGLGYCAAFLAGLVARVYSVEIVEEFANEANSGVRQTCYRAVGLRVGDGSCGWAEHVPRDEIVVTAAADETPQALLRQLKPDGCVVLPMGADEA
jgi:protein-L-isoaspartate(D-aspartate) O-methyltransferase